ncbi:MAG TPA: hypothetical protein VHB97_05110 [Polyangia bacterium]|nr:hypothetical protein [Polyangia bacterium]
MKRDSGLVNISALFGVMGLTALFSLDLAAVRLGFVRTLRLLRNVWAAVPELSTLGMVLGAVSLLAFAATMTWRRLRARDTRATRPRTFTRSVGGWRAAALVGGLAALAAVGGCATTAPRAHSPAALCSDLTLDHRSLYCANDFPHTNAPR